MCISKCIGFCNKLTLENKYTLNCKWYSRERCLHSFWWVFSVGSHNLVIIRAIQECTPCNDYSLVIPGAAIHTFITARVRSTTKIAIFRKAPISITILMRIIFLVKIKAKFSLETNLCKNVLNAEPANYSIQMDVLRICSRVRSTSNCVMELVDLARRPFSKVGF